jgi:hypothetical protein
MTLQLESKPAEPVASAETQSGRRPKHVLSIDLEDYFTLRLFPVRSIALSGSNIPVG